MSEIDAYFLQRIAEELETITCQECRQRLIRARNTVVDTWDRQRGRHVMSERQRLPNRRGSVRFSFTHAGRLYSATLSKFADGQLGEIFIDAHKPDSELAVHANDAAVLASLLLQHGVTAAAIRHSIAGPLATALAHAEEDSA